MTYTKVSVLIPTRSRLDRLKTLLTSFEQTERGASELVFRVDEDDSETIRTLLGYPTLVGPRLGYRGLPAYFNELAAAATGDVLMCGNDDMVFVTPGWDVRLLEVANLYPDGLFDLGVRTHNETHYPFATVSRFVVDRLGFLFDPRIFWGDIFLRDVMASFDRCIMVDGVIIDHDWAGNNPDDVFLEGERTRRSNWMQQHGEAVTEAIAKLEAA